MTAPIIALVTCPADKLSAYFPTAAEPEVVHLYSLDRAPADPRVQNVPRERLLEMALAIRQTLPRIVVEVF